MNHEFAGDATEVMYNLYSYLDSPRTAWPVTGFVAGTGYAGGLRPALTVPPEAKTAAESGRIPHDLSHPAGYGLLRVVASGPAAACLFTSPRVATPP
jgi:hypothetical protein